MNRVSFQIQRLEYLKRHLSNIWPHLTLRKMANWVLNEVEFRLVRTNPRSMPPFIKVEPTPLCQLRCMGCPQRDADFRNQLDNSMCLKLENFKKIVDPLSKTLVGVSLSLTGEPLLNKEIVSLIAYLHEENIGVSFPTNFSLKLSDDQIESLVRSGLDSIMISLDGASAETYSKYRVGGDFDLVLRNVKSLAEAKKQLRSRRPIIIWKFIIFDHNRHETERVKSQFKALGFDAYEFMVDLRSVVHADQYQREKQDLVKSRRPCYWLWNTTIIRWNGAVDPCCNVSSFLQAPFNLGNALEKDIRDIWHGKEYQRLREGFVKKTYGLNMHPLCRRCMRCPAVGEYVEPG